MDFGTFCLVIPLVYFSAKNPKNFINYPQIRAKTWTTKIVLINALGGFSIYLAMNFYLEEYY